MYVLTYHSDCNLPVFLKIHEIFSYLIASGIMHSAIHTGILIYIFFYFGVLPPTHQDDFSASHTQTLIGTFLIRYIKKLLNSDWLR